MLNPASSIHALTERDQVMPPARDTTAPCPRLPTTRLYPLDGIKAVLLSSRCRRSRAVHVLGGDSFARSALPHPAFQPFPWPMMRDTSATYVDVKVFDGKELLFRYSSSEDSVGRGLVGSRSRRLLSRPKLNDR